MSYDGIDRAWSEPSEIEAATLYGHECARCGAKIVSVIPDHLRESDDSTRFAAFGRHHDRVRQHICVPRHLADIRKRIDFNASEREQLEALMCAIADALATPGG